MWLSIADSLVTVYPLITPKHHVYKPSMPATGPIILNLSGPNPSQTTSKPVVLKLDVSDTLWPATELIVFDLRIPDPTQTTSKAVIVKLITCHSILHGPCDLPI